MAYICKNTSAMTRLETRPRPQDMNSDEVYGPFHMKEFTVRGPVYQCRVQVVSASSPLCRAIESEITSEDDAVFERVLVFPLAAQHAGTLVHIKLVEIFSCGTQVLEWPKDKVVISSQRFTNGVLMAAEEREISGAEHAISSVYVRGMERVSIMCKFAGDDEPKHTIVHVDLRLCPDAGVRIIDAGGGGGGVGVI